MYYRAFKWQGTSINATYTRLVAAGSPLAEQVRREFKMPERRVAYLRLIGLALSTNIATAWAEIERMALTKRPTVPLDVCSVHCKISLLLVINE